jgi:hypothetical protein
MDLRPENYGYKKLHQNTIGLQYLLNKWNQELTDINRSESENLIERDFIDRSTDQRD